MLSPFFAENLRPNLKLHDLQLKIINMDIDKASNLPYNIQ